MPVVLDVLNEAAVLIGSQTIGQTLNADDSAIFFTALNDMVDAWNAQRLNIFTISQASKVLTPAKASYQIGPTGADWPDLPRPITIQSAAILASVLGSMIRISYPDLLSAKEWHAIPEKSNQAVLARSLYCDYGEPFATIYIHPVPSQATTLELFTWNPLPQFAGPGDVLNFPPAYIKALKYNLAVNIGPMVGVQVDDKAWQTVMQIAQSTQEAMRQLNADLMKASYGMASTGNIPTMGLTPPAPPAAPPAQ